MKKQTGVISFLTILCFLLVIWLPCQAVDDSLYVCKNNKTGAPRLVKSPTLCKAKTEYLVTITSGTQGPTGAQGAQGPAGPSSGAKVYDAADQLLGIFLELDDEVPTIKILIESSVINVFTRVAVINVFTGEIEGVTLSYESTDCTGTPYMPTENLRRVRRNGGKYYTGTYMDPVGFPVNSSFFDSKCHPFVPPSTCPAPYLCKLPPMGGGVVAIEVTLPFTTPVALPMRLE